MENHFPTPELSRLYGILDREVRDRRLESKDNIRVAALYKDNRATTDDQPEIFNPIGQAPFNSAMGFWCFTRLYYDEHGRAIRRVPGVRGSWNLRKKFPMPISEGERWCRRKLTYEGFTMMEYSLGGEEDQGAARNRPPNRGQRDLPKNPVVLPGNSPRQGGIADESTDILQGHANAPTNTAAVAAAAPQLSPLHENLNKKRKLEIYDPEDKCGWPIENPALIELILELVKSATGQSMHENPDEVCKKNKQDMGTEGNQSTMQFLQAPQNGAAGNVNESAMHYDQNLSHQPCIMPTQEGLHTYNQDYQQCVTSGTILNSDQVQPSGMADQWNMYIDHYYAPGESSAPYNLGFGDEDIPPAPKFD